MAKARLALRSERLITPLDTIGKGIILIEDGRIAQIGAEADVSLSEDVMIRDFGDKIIAPGLIDIHGHGYGGVMVGQSVEATLQVARSFATNGTTSFLPTTGMAPTLEGILEQLRHVVAAMKEDSKGAEILGIHQEGPFISKAGRGKWDRYPPSGASAGRTARDPSVDEVHRMMEAADGAMMIMSIAPELEGALGVIRELARMNVVASAAHTAASYAETMAGVEAGLKSATHLYNGMRRQDHREPGVIEAVLACDDLKAELIGDCIHVHPPAMDIALRCKGVDGIVLITDSSTLAGMPNGTYKDNLGREIIKDDDKAYIPGWTLAGSVTTLSRNVHNVVARVGYPLADALKLATVNPARLIGVADRKGSLEVGKDADLILIDDEVKVYATMVKGRFVYEA